MADEIVLGVNAFTEQPERRRFQQGIGWNRIRSWKGPQALYDAFIGEVLIDQPEDVSVTKGVPCTIEATYAEDDPSQEEVIWELIPSAMDKTLGSHPAFNTSSSTAEVIEQVEKDIRNGTAYQRDYDTEFTSLNMNDYAKLRLKGVDSYRVWTFTIRKTVTTARAATVKAEQADTQKVISYAQIGLPTDVKWVQPSMVEWAGSGTPSPIDIDQWLATPPTVRYEKKRYSITKEWIGAVEWYKILYYGGKAEATADGFYR
jgi:hypothetical protein